MSSLSASSLFTHSSQTSCGPESSGSELTPATPAPHLLQGLLGSDDEEQEDPKDYCKGKAIVAYGQPNCHCKGSGQFENKKLSRLGPCETDDQQDIDIEV